MGEYVPVSRVRRWNNSRVSIAVMRAAESSSGIVSMQIPRVCLCLSNGLFCECLSASLRQTGEVTCHSITVEKVLEVLNSDHRSFSKADLLILDASVSIDIVERVLDETRRSLPDCKLILLVSEQAVSRMVELAQLRSHGCLFENVLVSDVLIAIKCVLAGKTFCSPQLANSLLAQIGKADPRESWSRHLDNVQLTTREREILGLISRERLCNKQIARRLSVSLYTVKNHVHNIIEKLGAQDRYDAAEIARGKKLLVANRTPVADTVTL